MASRINRTVICSVVFLDIVEYSRKPVAAQIRLKERLNDLLTTALADVAPNDRIILDTGDGAAISFLGDPEDALFVGLSLREALAGPQLPETADLRMRIGINLGPVKLITDLNGQPNIIGDGINVAQRVMSFAEAGQILVSRSYYEVVSCMSEDYVKLFQYEGARTDKHVREHEVYAVGSSQLGMMRASASVGARSPRSRRAAPLVVVDRLAETATIVQDNLLRKPRLSTALAVGLILATAVTIRVSLETGSAANSVTEATIAAPTIPASPSVAAPEPTPTVTTTPPAADDSAPPAVRLPEPAGPRTATAPEANEPAPSRVQLPEPITASKATAPRAKEPAPPPARAPAVPDAAPVLEPAK
ncbi:MAG: adenylate/guanylate cyclase domain-containing protein, partial [Betaproteobacteria bacterium]|nr:adenylate/guanylate cyclase domain-containing protein [Betaproteobacteria bacterium]